MSKPKALGRPPVKDLKRRHSFTVSLTSDERKGLIEQYGSLSAAIQGLASQLPKHAEQTKQSQQVTDKLRDLQQNS